MIWTTYSHIVSAYQPIISGDNSHIIQVRECAIRALCVSHAILIIGIGMPKEKRIELKTRMLFPIIIPSPYNAYCSAQYAPISTVTDEAHDNGAMIVSLLHDSMVSDDVSL